MAEMNGFADGAGQPALSVPERINFSIGGKDVPVRAMQLFDLQCCKEYILALDPTLDKITYGTLVLNILAYMTSPEDSPLEVLDAKAKAMAKSCSGKELLALPTRMNELLGISGFDAPGEAEAGASPGTGTSTELSPNSPPATSAPATQDELAEPTV